MFFLQFEDFLFGMEIVITQWNNLVYSSNGKYPPEEGQITRLPESACDIVNFFQIYIFRMWGESGLNFLCKLVVNI